MPAKKDAAEELNAELELDSDEELGSDELEDDDDDDSQGVEYVDAHETNLTAAAEITAAAVSDAGEMALNNPERVAALLSTVYKAIAGL